MADRKTREALLRLRRVNEIGARRALIDARDVLTRATDASERAGERARHADEKLAVAGSGKAPGTAGALEVRERYLQQLREGALRARKRAQEAAESLRVAETGLRHAQQVVAGALRAREAAEAQAAALRAQSEREKARREESAQEDRFGSRNRRRK